MLQINFKTLIFAILMAMFFIGCSCGSSPYFIKYAGVPKSDCSTCKVELFPRNNI